MSEMAMFRQPSNTLFQESEAVQDLRHAGFQPFRLCGRERLHWQISHRWACFGLTDAEFKAPLLVKGAI
jgi:hypothetical protein